MRLGIRNRLVRVYIEDAEPERGPGENVDFSTEQNQKFNPKMT